MTLKGTDDEAEIRALLLLSSLDSLDKVVKKAELKIVRDKEKSADYTKIFDGLAQSGFIIYPTKKAAKKKAGNETKTEEDKSRMSLTQAGYDELVKKLKRDNFQFEGQQFGGKIVNALVKLIQNLHNVQGTEVLPKITSYDDFKILALDSFDRLNRGYNYNNFVPIYRMRAEIGERVDRLEFNNWMFKVQEERIFHLRTGGLDATEEQKRDSINDEYRGLLFLMTKF
jgi:hypothetical protein